MQGSGLSVDCGRRWRSRRAALGPGQGSCPGEASRGPSNTWASGSGRRGRRPSSQPALFAFWAWKRIRYPKEGGVWERSDSGRFGGP